MNLVKMKPSHRNMLLLAICIPIVNSLVPPPVNVTVTCQNFKNIINWTYSDPSLHPQFTVKMYSYDRDEQIVCSDITDYSCDVTNFTKTTEDSYYFEVMAVVGTETSEPESSPTFSYDSAMTVDIYCSLDFPSVLIAFKSNIMEVKFRHPSELYKHDLETKTFSYDILTGDNSAEVHRFTCSTNMCENTIPVPRPMFPGHCIKLRGTINNIEIKATREICTGKEPEEASYWWVVLIVLLVTVAFILVVGIGWMFWKKKTAGTDSLPKFMASLFSNLSSSESQQTFRPESDVLIFPASIVAEPLLKNGKDSEAMTPSSMPLEEGGRFLIGETHTLTSNGSAGPDVEGGSNPGVVVVSYSGYDRPHVQVIEEMNPGDNVECYRPVV